MLGTSLEWLWLLKRGPHGPSFSWRTGPAPGYNALEHLSELIAEHEQESPGWSERVRSIALEALDFDENEIVRRAIQVLCVVARDEDLIQVRKHLSHPCEEVQNDAKACLFQRGVKGNAK